MVFSCNLTALWYRTTQSPVISIVWCLFFFIFHCLKCSQCPLCYVACALIFSKIIIIGNKRCAFRGELLQIWVSLLWNYVRILFESLPVANIFLLRCCFFACLISACCLFAWGCLFSQGCSAHGDFYHSMFHYRSIYHPSLVSSRVTQRSRLLLRVCCTLPAKSFLSLLLGGNKEKW